jgi:hypothetical protein
VHEGLAQILGARSSLAVRQRDVPRGAVMADHMRVVDGDVRRALLEVDHRIAARLHGLFHQTVGLADRQRGIIDEARLDVLPGGAETLLLLGRQRPDIEGLDTLLPGLQLPLRAAWSVRFHGGLVFGPELIFQGPGPPAPVDVPDHQADDHGRENDDDRDDRPRVVRYGVGIHTSSIDGASPPSRRDASLMPANPFRRFSARERRDSSNDLRKSCRATEVRDGG